MWPAQARERRLVEDLSDQAEVLVHHHARTVADRDPRGLLAAVLKRVETEVGQLRDLFTPRPNAEHAARVLRARALGVEVLPKPAVASGHLPLLASWIGERREALPAPP